MSYLTTRNLTRIMDYLRTKFVAKESVLANSAINDGDGMNISKSYLKSGGGTMTGSLTIKNTDIVDKATKPLEPQYREIGFCTNDGTDVVNRYAAISSSVSDTGATGVVLRVYKFANNDKSSGSIGIFNDNGEVYTSAPTPAVTDDSNKIATTAYVNLAISKALEQFADGDSKTY